MRKFLMFILLITAFSAKTKSQAIDSVLQVPIDTCVNAELSKCISNYISKVYWLFPISDTDRVYYTIHFFTKRKVNYFTIWTSYFLPYKNKKPHDIYFYKINGFDIIFIKYKKDEIPLFNEKCMYKEGGYWDSRMEFDGPVYPRTYIYKEKDGKYTIEKSKKVIFDFRPNYEHYKYFKKHEYPVDL